MTNNVVIILFCCTILRYQTYTEQANKTEQTGFLFCSTKTDEANRTEHNPLGLFCLFVLMWVVLHQNGEKR
ncbi:MAG: hypothetical protein EBU08_01065 [Micrococcales bacterium]|nr:hypothetical protein [Micrococcales bacterium]